MGEPRYAIAGLGVTNQGVLPGTSAEQLTWDAIELALKDSGLARRQINGFIFQPGIGGGTSGLAASRAALAANTALQINSGGATGILAIMTAIGLIESGAAEYVVCAHGTNARSQKVLVGEGGADRNAIFGLFSPGASAALAAQSYFTKYNKTSEDLAQVAVALRANASCRPDAYMYNRPITVEDHQNSPFIVRPLHMLDYCLVTDGAVAFIVTTAERARDLQARPVYLRGFGASHSIAQGYLRGTSTALGEADFEAEPTRSRAFGQAGLTVDDIDVFQFYDAFTILVAQQLEAYGLCGPGEAADWIRSNNFVWNTKRPCNTSGTEHSWSYVQGFTHLTEGIRQLRGEAGPTQVAGARTCLVTGIGATGPGTAHAAAILSAD
jgi:acetyl-CoA acetyltransferase